jgi:hypothetical protein
VTKGKAFSFKSVEIRDMDRAEIRNALGAVTLGCFVGLVYSWRTIEARLREGPIAYVLTYIVLFAFAVLLSTKLNLGKRLTGKAAIMLGAAILAGGIAMFCVQAMSPLGDAHAVKRVLVAFWWSLTVLMSWLPGFLGFAIWAMLGGSSRKGQLP